MNKSVALQQIIARLDAEILRYVGAAREAQAGATDEQSRAENKYDTRGLEASYLAHGQSRKALEATEAREQLSKLDVQQSSPDDLVGIGALVELDSDGEQDWYFLAPAAGGMEVVCEGKGVLVITPQSPLGCALLGKRCGEEVRINAGKTSLSHRIVSIL